MDFLTKLAASIKRSRSLVCVGLDPDPALMPPGVDVLDFNKAVIDATAEFAGAYKLNFAFFEALGSRGFEILSASARYIPPDIIKIGDAKRGDIGNTSRAYARAVFEVLGFDATTVSPYLGFDSIEPFAAYPEKGIFVLCRTSNTGAGDFQDLVSVVDGKPQKLFEIVAAKVDRWNKRQNMGLVVGATYQEELRAIRQQYPDMPLLIPGIGAQGGDLELTVKNGVDAGAARTLINSSRQIIFASKGQDFAQAARQAAMSLRDRINAQLAT